MLLFQFQTLPRQFKMHFSGHLSEIPAPYQRYGILLQLQKPIIFNDKWLVKVDFFDFTINNCQGYPYNRTLYVGSSVATDAYYEGSGTLNTQVIQGFKRINLHQSGFLKNM